MSLLEVNPAGLQMLALQCRSWAIELGVTTASDVAGGPGQTSADAVRLLNGSVDTATQVLTGRLESTAEQITAAGVGYSAEEVRSATALYGLRAVS